MGWLLGLLFIPKQQEPFVIRKGEAGADATLTHAKPIDFSTITPSLTHFLPRSVAWTLTYFVFTCSFRMLPTVSLSLPSAVRHIGRSLYFYRTRRGKIDIAAVRVPRSSFPLAVLRLFVAATVALRLPLQFLKQTRLIITSPSRHFGLVPYSSPPLAMQVACRSS